MALLAVVYIYDFDCDWLHGRLIKCLADDATVALADDARVFEVLGHDHGNFTVLLEVCDAGRVNEHIDATRIDRDPVFVTKSND